MRLRTRLSTAAAVGGALIAPLVPIGSVAPAGAVSTDTIGAAVAFLDTRQQADGGFDTFFPGFETPDAVFALASAGQADSSWSAEEARAAVTSPTFTTTGGKTPLDAIDDWTDGVQGNSTATASAKSAQAAKVIALVAAPLGLSAPDGLAATDFDPSGDTATPVDLVAAIEAAAGTGDYAAVPIAARAYVVLALDGLGRPVPTALTNGLIAAQQADGGYNFGGDPDGFGVDPDVTALVALALVASETAAATEPIRRAVFALGATQAGDGQWATDFDGPNPNSTAVVMLLGAALGADPSNSCWRDAVEPGMVGVSYPSPAAAIEALQTPDGNIASPSDSFGVNTFATSQAIQALAAAELAAFYRFAPPCTPPAATDARRLVNSLYVDVLGRIAEPGGAEYWTGQVAAGFRPALIAKRFTGTAEYGRAVTGGLYRAYLGGPATPAEEQAGARLVVAGRRFDLAAGILGGQEYYDRTAPEFGDPVANNDTWGAALYEDALGRPQVLPDDQDFVEGRLAAGWSRTRIARTLLLSAEGRTAWVRGLYEDLLRRQPSDPDLTFWTGRLKQGVSPEQLVTQFVGSAEYRRLTAA